MPLITFIRRFSLSQWIIISMLLGILIGWQFPGLAQHGKVLSTLFLHLIKCIVVPLVFGTLVVGIASHADDLKAVGRLALRSLIYFELVTTAALFVGLGAVNLLRPGDGVQLRTAAKPKSCPSSPLRSPLSALSD
jgi:proton glutamate symport protein